MSNSANAITLFSYRVSDNHDTSDFQSAVVADLNALTQLVKEMTLDYFNSNIPDTTPGALGVSVFVQTLGLVVNYSLTLSENVQTGQTVVEATYSSGAQVTTSACITLAFEATLGPVGAVVGDYMGKLAGQVALDIQRDPNGASGWYDRFKMGAQCLAEDIWGDLLSGDLKPSLAWLFDPAQRQAFADLLFPSGAGAAFDNAFSAYNTATSAYPLSPLVLDLDGDGTETTALNTSGTHFDLDIPPTLLLYREGSPLPFTPQFSPFT